MKNTSPAINSRWNSEACSMEICLLTIENRLIIKPLKMQNVLFSQHVTKVMNSISKDQIISFLF